MKYLKMLGLAAIAAMALTAFAASTASATTLEVNGATQNKAVTLQASVEPGSTVILSRTDGTLANTCSTSNVEGTTETFTGTKVTSKELSLLTFETCLRTVTVDRPGRLYIEHIAGTTNGTVFSEEAEVTVLTPFGGTEVNCKTGTGTHLGTLTGKAAGAEATMDINAVLNCGFLLPSAKWTGSYTVTSPTGLGVSA